jgi:DNA-binding GntR family transcriptional regulator
MSDIASIEKLLDDYIVGKKLAHGYLLPDIQGLAKQLGCQRDAVDNALEAAAKKHKVARDPGGWAVISSAHRDHHPFSLTKSARSHDRELTNDLVVAEVRLPVGQDHQEADEKHPFHDVERKAQRELGLAEHELFIVVERFRLLDGCPLALHRAYLNPSRFPSDFLKRYSFSIVSLIDTYTECGYELLYRDTVLEARSTNTYERALLAQWYQSKSRDYAVLDAEQLLFAKDPTTGMAFVLEFLKASYLEHWQYTIKNRPVGAT